MKSIPIILLVSERSGSNLLRSLLGNHKDICAPVAPHLMAEFYNIRKYYGDIRIKENSKNLLTDMLKVTNHSYHDWKLEVKIDKIVNNSKSLVKSFNTLFSEKAKQEGKIHYCSKGIDSFEFIDPFRSELENIKFIHLVRDPRDHVASWMKRPINLLTPYDAIKKWKLEQEVIIDAIKTKGLNCISVKYEDLISDTPVTMTNILNHIGIEIDKNCFSTNRMNKESNRNPYWQNLSKPIMSNNKGKFMKELSDEDVLIIESIAKKEMNFFGYEPVTLANWKPSSNYFTKLEKIRKRKSMELSKNPSEKMGDLKDKWKLIKKLKTERVNKWKEHNDTTKFNDTTYNMTFKDRFKYLSFGLLGEKMTNNILSKIK